MTTPERPDPRSEAPSVGVLAGYAGVALVLFGAGALGGEEVRALTWPVGGLVAGIAFVTLLWSRVRPGTWSDRS